MKAEVRNIQLPLFPLNVVLFPNARLPLHIFEDRYKSMINDVLADKGEFGVVYCGPKGDLIAQVGCIARIGETVKFEDGRMNIDTTGTVRFRVKALIKEKPYLVAYVETIEDIEVEEKSYLFARELKETLSHVINLSSHLNDLPLEIGDIWPEDPVTLSYVVPETLYGDLEAKQNLLELVSVNERLKLELAFLNDARKYLAAQKALKDALS